jgi:hypothetical protein
MTVIPPNKTGDPIAHREQVDTVIVTTWEIMRSREFHIGVDEVRAGQPPRFDEMDDWNYERGRCWALLAPANMGPVQHQGSPAAQHRKEERVYLMTRRNSQPRTLGDLQLELSRALKNKTLNMLEIGRLLNEAKALVEHGEWLPWLRRHTPFTERTAQRYQKAAEWVAGWAVKYDTVADLDFDRAIGYLAPKAVYALASGRYTDEVVVQVLQAAAAQERHISEANVEEIAKAGAEAAALLREIRADAEATKQKAEAERSDLLLRARAASAKAEVEMKRVGGPSRTSRTRSTLFLTVVLIPRCRPHRSRPWRRRQRFTFRHSRMRSRCCDPS